MDIIVNADLQPQSDEARPIEAFYLNILNQLYKENTQPPLAQWLAKLNQLQGQWTAVTPIHWQATHNDALLTAYGKDLGLTMDCSRFYTKQFMNFLQDDVSNIYIHSPDLWLMQFKRAPVLLSPPPHTIYHQSLLPVLKVLDSSQYWQRLFTEIQMLSATAHFKQSAQSRLAVNGLWFWGQGALVQSQKRVVGDDENLLKQLQSIASYTLLNDLKGADISDETLIILNSYPSTEYEKIEPGIRRYNRHWHSNNGTIVEQKESLWKRLGRLL